MEHTFLPTFIAIIINPGAQILMVYGQKTSAVCGGFISVSACVWMVAFGWKVSRFSLLTFTNILRKVSVLTVIRLNISL